MKMNAEETESVVMNFIPEAQDLWQTHANEYSGSVRDKEFLYKMRNY